MPGCCGTILAVVSCFAVVGKGEPELSDMEATTIENDHKSTFAIFPDPTQQQRVGYWNEPPDKCFLCHATTCWERGAVKIKNTNITNPYLEAVRQTHDPIQHVKTIEDELKGTIGRALGKQGEKILRAVHSMEEQLREYERLLQGGDHDDISSRSTNATNDIRRKKKEELLNETARRYNQYREQALTARWELTVHRQAAGLIVGNHQYVVQAYPIAEKLPVDHPPQPHPADSMDTNQATSSTPSAAQTMNAGNLTAGTTTTMQPTKKKFTGQLEWWQTVGRWR